MLGREATRAVGLSDLTDPDAISEVQRRLDRLGVDRELARAGATDGSTVVIGDFSFEYSSGTEFEGGTGRRTRRQRRG